MEKQIAQALRIRYEMVQGHLNDFKNSKKLKPENGSLQSHFNPDQTSQLLNYLETNTYPKVEHIFSYVKEIFGVECTVLGMTKWLQRSNFSYKNSKGSRAKADPEKQAQFIKYYENLLNTLLEDEPIEFADAVHPTIATKITHGWGSKGKINCLPRQAPRARASICLCQSI